jgi:hypothetical protein
MASPLENLEAKINVVCKGVIRPLRQQISELEKRVGDLEEWNELLAGMTDLEIGGTAGDDGGEPQEVVRSRKGAGSTAIGLIQGAKVARISSPLDKTHPRVVTIYHQGSRFTFTLKKDRLYWLDWGFGPGQHVTIEGRRSGKNTNNIINLTRLQWDEGEEENAQADD